MKNITGIYWRQFAIPGIMVAAYAGGIKWALLVAVASMRVEYSR